MGFSRQLRLCISVFVLTWLYGCATPIVPYRPPAASEETVKLFIKGKLENMGLSRFDTFAHSEQCTEPQSLTTATAGQIDAAIEIPANASFTVRFFQQLPNARCTYIATFEPKRNHKYYLEPFDNLQVCGFVIFDVSSGDRVLESSARKRVDINSRKTFCSIEQPPTMAKKSYKSGLTDLRDLLPAD